MKRTSEDPYRTAFQIICLLLVAFTLFGVGRVAISSSAAEASIRSGELKKDIDAERRIGDVLEIDMSALTTPSRIERIAGTSMKMTEAPSVSYMAFPATMPEAHIPAEKAPVVADAEASAGVFASVVRMAVGEAHIMLIGDVGLASSE